MRIRSTKPEFWRSERIASVCWEHRLVLKGLESFVDDNGVGKDDLALIVADVFPRDLSRNPTGTLQKVSEAISDLENAGLIWRYEDDGTNLLYISFWESVQRIEKPSNGRFRRPDGTLAYRESIIGASFREGSGSIPGGLRPGTGEQGNRGTGEQVSSSSADADGPSPVDAAFDAWWASYPKKVGKGAAAKAYKAAAKKVDHETLLSALVAQRDQLMHDGAKFCPHPSTWLNQERWADEEPSTDAEVRDILPPMPRAPSGLSDEEWADWYAREDAKRRSAG